MDDIKHTCCGLRNYAHGKVSDLMTVAEQYLAAKIARAEASGPSTITKDATIAEFISPGGKMVILRRGTNSWTAFPGNENIIGDVPMCCDPNGLRWILDICEGKPEPTNKAPGLVYMLCGAMQHSNTDPFDKRSKGIPIGPHWMITWPFDSKRDGIPNDVRDAGAWVMFDGTPYAYLHVCGTPWAGNVYDPSKDHDAIWTMQYRSN